MIHKRDGWNAVLTIGTLVECVDSLLRLHQKSRSIVVHRPSKEGLVQAANAIDFVAP